MSDLVLNDETLRDILYRFVKDYAEAQHAIEITEVAGSGAFELILTIIVAAVTGGAGVVAAVGSKMYLVRKFNKVGDLLADFAKATKRIKNRKKAFNGKNTGPGKLESVNGSVKKTDAHGAETGEMIKPEKVYSDKTRTVALPQDLVAAESGVYGYLPTQDSQFHSSRWPVDWTSADEVANARAVRLDYHDGLNKKKAAVDELRKSGVSEEEIARKIVDKRNQDRLAHYKTPESLEAVYKRNTKKYGSKYGPSYESQLEKYGSPENVIDAALRSNDTVDILTGIATPK